MCQLPTFLYSHDVPCRLWTTGASCSPSKTPSTVLCYLLYVQLWTGQLTELDGWMSTSWTSTRSSKCWVYLEPIFGGGPLPQEQGRFKHIDKVLRWWEVAAHAVHSNASCSTDLTCMCTFCTYTYCEIVTGIDTVFSFHCEDSAVHYCYIVWCAILCSGLLCLRWSTTVVCCIILFLCLHVYVHTYVRIIYAHCPLLYACSCASAVNKHHCCLSFSLLQFLSVCAPPCLL